LASPSTRRGRRVYEAAPPPYPARTYALARKTPARHSVPMEKQALRTGLIVVATLAFATAGVVIVAKNKRTPSPESAWDGRFIASPTDYGVRFRTEPPTSPTKSPMPPTPWTVVEVPPNPAKPETHVSRFDMTPVAWQPSSGPNPIPGDIEPPIPATQPIDFPAGGSAKLRCFVGVEYAGRAPEKFAWAMAPDGKPLNQDEAVASGWSPDKAAVWHKSPYGIHAVFETQGEIVLSGGHLTDTSTGRVVGYDASFSVPEGSVRIFRAEVGAWSGPSEMIFHAFGCAPQVAELAITHDAEIKLGSATIRHVAAFPCFMGGNIWRLWGRDPAPDTQHFSTSGDARGTVHFILMPDDDDLDRYTITPGKNLTGIVGANRFGPLKTWLVPGESVTGDGFHVTRLPEVRRIRMNLPPFPGGTAITGIEDPLDWPVPAHWDRSRMTVGNAVNFIAELHVEAKSGGRSIVVCNMGGGDFYPGSSRLLSEFPGKTTVREILAEALREELNRGASLEINRDARTCELNIPAWTLWDRVVERLREYMK
jgi:hypothetical protein